METILKIKKYLIGVCVGIFALILVYFKGKSEGKQEEKEKQNEKILDDVKKVNTARSNTDKLTRVRKKYSKK